MSIRYLFNVFELNLPFAAQAIDPSNFLKAERIRRFSFAIKDAKSGIPGQGAADFP